MYMGKHGDVISYISTITFFAGKYDVCIIFVDGFDSNSVGGQIFDRAFGIICIRNGVLLGSDLGPDSDS